MRVLRAFSPEDWKARGADEFLRGASEPERRDRPLLPGVCRGERERAPAETTPGGEIVIVCTDLAGADSAAEAARLGIDDRSPRDVGPPVRAPLPPSRLM